LRLLYQETYGLITRLAQNGCDTAADSREARKTLLSVWSRMSAAEREPFLAPGCLDIGDSPLVTQPDRAARLKPLHGCRHASYLPGNRDPSEGSAVNGVRVLEGG
jgi:hypothetical protein